MMLLVRDNGLLRFPLTENNFQLAERYRFYQRLIFSLC